MLLLRFSLLLATACAMLLASSPATLTAAELVKDDFSQTEHPQRRATRGPWQFAHQTAICRQDDALYAQFKNHGPVIWYDLDFTNAVIQFQFKPDPLCKTFVFTINGKDGHVFRFVTSPRNTTIRAFPMNAKVKSILLGSPGPALNTTDWTAVKLTLSGTSATLQIGTSYTETVTHDSFAQPKTTVGLGFSFGTLSLKDLRISTP